MKKVAAFVAKNKKVCGILGGCIGAIIISLLCVLASGKVERKEEANLQVVINDEVPGLDIANNGDESIEAYTEQDSTVVEEILTTEDITVAEKNAENDTVSSNKENKNKISTTSKTENQETVIVSDYVPKTDKIKEPEKKQNTEKPQSNSSSHNSSEDTSTSNNASSGNEPAKEEQGNKPQEEPVKSEYKLVWEDNFDGTELNRDDWNVELHEPGWVNQEWQEYVDSDENIYVKDGNLIIQAVKTTKDGKDYYTSGRVNTQNKHDFKYGRFEARAKVPSGKGFLPAFWMMPTDESFYGQWPKCGEIDIMEVLGDNTNADLCLRALDTNSLYV